MKDLTQHSARKVDRGAHAHDSRNWRWFPFHSMLLAFAAATLVGCITGTSLRPHYTLYRAVGIGARLKEPASEWHRNYDRELMKMTPWAPNLELLRTNFRLVAREYLCQNTEPEPDYIWAYVSTNLGTYFIITNNAPNGAATLRDRVELMFTRIDSEHCSLLTDRRDTPRNCLTGGLPRMLSDQEPAGVALAPLAVRQIVSDKAVASERPLSDDGNLMDRTLTIKEFSGEFGLVGEPLNRVYSEYQRLHAAIEAKHASERAIPANTGSTNQKPKLDFKIEDFYPTQEITLTLSTVLNSAAVLDRIEYVSTFVYVPTFPHPGNGKIVLEQELWKRLFSVHAARAQDPLIRTACLDGDFKRAIEVMRVRLLDIGTEIKTNLNFGRVTQNLSSTGSLTLPGTTGLIPGVPITPSIGLGGSNSVQDDYNIQHQFDLRSTYIASDRNFIRITQRGLQTANTAGRFIEKLKIYVPVASERICVVTPSSTNGVHLRFLRQPLYPHVDALTVSVVVARRAKKLSSVKSERWRLDDPKDSEFYVGVTRPSHITLWEWNRMVGVTTLEDIDPQSKSPNQRVMIRPPQTSRVYELILDCSEDERAAFCNFLRSKALASRKTSISIPVVDANAEQTQLSVEVGLTDKDDPKKLAPLID